MFSSITISSLRSHPLSEVVLVLYGMRLLPSLNAFYTARSVCILLKINFHAVCAVRSYFVLNLLVFCNYMEPHRHCTLQINSKVLSIGINCEHQDSAIFYLKTPG
jgi:hypothetical protein